MWPTFDQDLTKSIVKSMESRLGHAIANNMMFLWKCSPQHFGTGQLANLPLYRNIIILVCPFWLAIQKIPKKREFSKIKG